MLVTSYSAKPQLQEKVLQAGIKLLPKELVANVAISVDKKIPRWSRHVDMVWVEDQQWFMNSMINQYYQDLTIDTYSDPVSFMKDIQQYPLDTRFILDTYYVAQDGTPYVATGYNLASQLHKMGYTKLILFSGEEVEAERIPAYLTVILKNDADRRQILNKI